jgi:prephenate dehydrogenase
VNIVAAAVVPWRRVTIIGCGLIGGSFALALRRSFPELRLAGWDADADALKEALRQGIIDEVDDAFDTRAVSSSDFIYLAMPVAQIIAFLRERGRQISQQALLTDAGSTKAEICRAAIEHLPAGVDFIGGHPIAGSHHAGIAHARADLFQDAPYVLTPSNESEALSQLTKILTMLGARVQSMPPAEHDQAMALVSHLPQLLSSTLATTAKQNLSEEIIARLSGSGYKDMTRLADSSWTMWRDILTTNRAFIAGTLDSYLDLLTRVRDELRQNEQRELAQTRALFASHQ